MLSKQLTKRKKGEFFGGWLEKRWVDVRLNFPLGILDDQIPIFLSTVPHLIIPLFPITDTPRVNDVDVTQMLRHLKSNSNGQSVVINRVLLITSIEKDLPTLSLSQMNTS